jgi:predicted GNAT family acetyltransferase
MLKNAEDNFEAYKTEPYETVCRAAYDTSKVIETRTSDPIRLTTAFNLVREKCTTAGYADAVMYANQKLGEVHAPFTSGILSAAEKLSSPENVAIATVGTAVTIAAKTPAAISLLGTANAAKYTKIVQGVAEGYFATQMTIGLISASESCYNVGIADSKECGEAFTNAVFLFGLLKAGYKNLDTLTTPSAVAAARTEVLSNYERAEQITVDNAEIMRPDYTSTRKRITEVLSDGKADALLAETVKDGTIESNPVSSAADRTIKETGKVSAKRGTKITGCALSPSCFFGDDPEIRGLMEDAVDAVKKAADMKMAAVPGPETTNLPSSVVLPNSRALSISSAVSEIDRLITLSNSKYEIELKTKLSGDMTEITRLVPSQHARAEVLTQLKTFKKTLETDPTTAATLLPEVRRIAQLISDDAEMTTKLISQYPNARPVSEILNELEMKLQTGEELEIGSKPARPMVPEEIQQIEEIGILADKYEAQTRNQVAEFRSTEEGQVETNVRYDSDGARIEEVYVGESALENNVRILKPEGTTYRQYEEAFGVKLMDAPDNVIFAMDSSGNLMGHMSYFKIEGGGFAVSGVEVTKGFRGKGVAEQLYQEAFRREGYYKGPCPMGRTADGAKFISGMLKKYGPEELGDNYKPQNDIFYWYREHAGPVGIVESYTGDAIEVTAEAMSPEEALSLGVRFYDTEPATSNPVEPE